MDVSTERIAVLKFSRLELARLLAAGELPEDVKQGMRSWLVGENQEIVDGMIDVKALSAGNGHGATATVEPKATPSPHVQKAMRKLRAGRKQLHCSVSGCPATFLGVGWLERHAVRVHGGTAGSAVEQ